MTDHNHIPTPPPMPGLIWRPLQLSDHDAITALSAACQAADGGQALIAANAYMIAPSADTPSRATIGAFDAGSQLAACAAVWLARVTSLLPARAKSSTAARPHWPPGAYRSCSQPSAVGPV